MSVATYPVRVEATLEPGMSRWLWLVKWLLAVPHFIVLFFLWIAFVAVSVVGFFAILFTGRYPGALFEFNVGVLRWSWRVAYYTYGALGTDRYPPFTLADVPDYPAHFDVERPRHLSRGLVLVKWWLLAIPHYLVVAFFVGGGTWALWQADGNTGGAPGLIGVLVLVAAVMLAFTGRYPEQVFDFVLGMNRWVLRVAAYAALMTDEYPPFRLDMGGRESVGTISTPPPPAPPPPLSPMQPPQPPSAAESAGATKHGWTAGRVVSLVVGCVLGLMSLGLLGAGGAAAWATNTQRDAHGYLTSPTRVFATPTYAVSSDVIDLGNTGDWITPGDVLGRLRIRATSTDPTTRVFVGVGPKDAVEAYLSRIDHLVVTNWANGDTISRTPGGAPAIVPSTARIWTEQASGFGTQALNWSPASGHWVAVVMNANASAGVSVAVDVGATLPDLGPIAVGLIVAGGVLLLGALFLIVGAAVRVSR